MYATLFNDSKKINFSIDKTLKVYKDELYFPFAYEVNIGSIKLTNRCYLIKDGIAYEIDSWFSAEYEVLSERRQLFERNIEYVINEAKNAQED